MKVCSVLGCGRIHWARSFCELHYKRWRRSGGMLLVVRNWTQAEDDVLLEMFAAGALDGAIGARVGRTATAVKQRRLLLRLLRKQRHPDNFRHAPGRPLLSPVTTLEPHYRPWPCRMGSSATMNVGETDCWSAWLPMRARMVALEERDAARDRRDAERFLFVPCESGMIVAEKPRTDAEIDTIEPYNLSALAMLEASQGMAAKG